jgi:hypothetical protein
VRHGLGVLVGADDVDGAGGEVHHQAVAVVAAVLGSMLK